VTDEPPSAPPAAAASSALIGRRRPAVLAAAVVVVIVLAAVGATAFGGPGRRVETGIVVAVKATGLTSVQGFSIRTADGRTVDFRVGTLENGAAFPPGHLAEHKVTLVPIRVTYLEEAGGHVAVRIEDAP
jgi:hypothetical protein